MNNRYGSLWSKWDLHIHTPYSIVHDYKSSDDVWEKYIYELEQLEDIKVLGINDYWFIDGYKKVLEYKKKGRLQNINLILPVIELRLEHLVGNNKTNKINYHIIFSNGLTAEEIEEEFIKKIEIKNLDNRSLTKKNLELYGEKILKEIPKEKNSGNSPLQEGFNNFTVSLDKVNELLSKKLFKGKYLTAIGRSEWNDFRWDGSADIKKTLINDVDIIFSASPNIEQFKKAQESLSKQKVNDLLLHCSDAHQFAQNEITNSKELGHCFTWIKAKPTFEGLKQVIYEPTYRLKITNQLIQYPLYYIDKVKLNFEDNILFKNNIFCFSGLKTTIAFNPNFTCIIGGRGSGKSTLLNLIAKKLNILENDFFSEFNINENDLLNSVEINPNTLINVEYLAQNTIESFAIDDKKFSKAIYNRINKYSQNKLINIENGIEQSLNKFDLHINNLQKRQQLHNKLKTLKQEFYNALNIVKTLTDKIYLEKKEKFQQVQKEYNQNMKSLNRLNSFLQTIAYTLTNEPFDILEDNISISDELSYIENENLNKVIIQNDFDILYNNVLEKIRLIYQDTINNDKFHNAYKKIDLLKKESGNIKIEIEEFLKTQDISEDSIQDIQKANENIEKLKIEIYDIKKEIRKLKQQIISFELNSIDLVIDEFKQEINKYIDEVNNILANISDNSSDVKQIKLSFELDEDIFEKIFDEFERELNIYEHIRSYRETFKNYIKEIDLNDILSLNNQEFIKKIELNHKNTQTFEKIEKIFTNKTNFLIFQTLILKYQRDIKNNKRFVVYYDNRDIKNSSFGQKCTSVIVIMLLLGNNPIIIDEPEAHLDSSLIANYLVDLIKTIKQKRQIIFATHNANFVLNGDADLIIKLDNIDGIIHIKSFTIEDLGYRDDLLKLEGGQEAFKKRENKYGI